MDLFNVLFARRHGISPSGNLYETMLGKKLGDNGVWETENAPYFFRRSGGSLRTRLLGKEKDTIVGASVAFNQLVNSGDTSVTVTSGHKYYANINNSKTIGSSNGSAISINDSTKDNVVDLTLMLGSSIADYIYTLESGTAGAGVAKLKEWGFFSEPYYAYDSGSIKSVSGLVSHKMVGKNLLNPSGYIETPTGGSGITVVNNGDGTFTVKGTATNNVYITLTDYQLLSDYCFIVANTSYTLSGRYGGDVYVGFGVYGSGTDYWAANESGATMSFTNEQIASKRYRLIIFVRNGTALGDDGIVIKPQIELGSTATDYEAFHADTYALDSDLILRGVPKMDADHNIYYDGDTYESSGKVTRYWGERAYEEGDVSDHLTIITDGTRTIYKLATPTTETADAFTSPQSVSKYGTEEYVTTQKFIPIGHNTEYKVTPIP